MTLLRRIFLLRSSSSSTSSRIVTPSTSIAASAALVATYCVVIARAFSVLPSSVPYRHRSVLSAATSLRMSSATTATTTTTTTPPRVLVPIADGSEEIETCCVTDTLTRFGADVTVASVTDEKTCTMSRGVRVVADATVAEAAASPLKWDAIVLPGGMPGATHLRDCADLEKMLRSAVADSDGTGTVVAAVCAAPAVVLRHHGLLPPGSTCYPAPVFRETLDGASDDKVVVRGRIVTSQGPGTSLLFALQVGEELFGKEKADQIAKEMLVER